MLHLDCPVWKTYIEPLVTRGSNGHDQTLKIGDLAKATHTKVETIRYYEQIGLLPTPLRTGGNFRAYTAIHLGFLSFIRRARDLGFTLNEVRQLLSLSDQKSRSCIPVDAIARRHLAAIERKIEDLNALRSELDNLINQCSCSTIAECRIIDALAPTKTHALTT